MCADGSEYPCELWRVSANNADINLVTDDSDGAVINLGDHIIAYIDDLGRIEGTIINSLRDGFALQLQHTSHQQSKLIKKISWLSKNINNQQSDQRRHARRAPARTEALLFLEDGTQHECKILDLSLSGAAVVTALRPPLLTIVTLGNTQAKVMRHFDDGIGIEFLVLQDDSLND